MDAGVGVEIRNSSHFNIILARGGEVILKVTLEIKINIILKGLDLVQASVTERWPEKAEKKTNQLS